MVSRTSPSASETTESLWREPAQPLRGYPRRRARRDADADDLLQTVFVRAHRQLPTRDRCCWFEFDRRAG